MSRLLMLFAAPMEMAPGLEQLETGGSEVRCTGIGPVAAAVGAARAIAECQPERIIYLGTCGSYDSSKHAIGAVVAAGNVILTSGEILAGQARVPDLQSARLECKTDELSDAIPIVDVACTVAITEDADLATRLGAVAAVENLELFSLLVAAGDIPVTALLGVTNLVGPGGGREWAKNHAALMRDVGQAAGDLL